MENDLIFITGGARSGKSTFAEKVAGKNARKQGHPLYYVATSNVEDTEMAERIHRHREDRNNGLYHWTTIECPIELENAASPIEKESVVLVDCITILLTNELFRYGYDEEHWGNSAYQRQVVDTIMRGIDALRNKTRILVIVSNEVVFEAPRASATLVQIYQQLIGTIHQRIVHLSNQSYLVEAGIPMIMKGE